MTSLHHGSWSRYRWRASSSRLSPQWFPGAGRRAPTWSRSCTPNEMRAVVYDRYGPPDVLRLEDVERPVPGDDEILIKVHATTVNRLDCATRDANRRTGVAISLISRLVFGIRRPRRRILGSEFAGVVEAVGTTVSEFAVGDQVFGATGMGFGAHAEFMCMRQNARIALKPIGMSFEQAAAVCDGAFNALSCLRPIGPRKGQMILIYGASALERRRQESEVPQLDADEEGHSLHQGAD